jgi:sulfur relay (sulfurtransferase) DsrC/TusE family protein
VADKKLVCAILNDTKVTLTQDQYDLVKKHRDLIRKIKKNPAVQKKLGCNK